MNKSLDLYNGYRIVEMGNGDAAVRSLPHG